ncbi:hypothetical protein [Paeniglutamicibacter terrestris]|uniref:Uncharacterized protein n=1 Tax=Paeniglutamicibacter terrestris TaxID=2723403 RepID=A0ABX1G484_9MICC|nr:hypothetical protein [Paeniglutamicibacter terrestris]NKG21057.1 hypothetical protein [Paeniglutamicibacter terrestris]
MDSETEARVIELKAEDRTAIALAFLEATPANGKYVLSGSPEAFIAVAVEYLHKASRAVEATAQAAADRAALEADAWELYTAAFPDDHPYPAFGRMPGHLAEAWLRVARKARERHGVKP